MKSVTEAIDQVESSEPFKEWKKAHEKSFLAHCFFMDDAANKHMWQIGFYNEDDTITSFFVDDEVTIAKQDEIFKKEETKLKELKKENIQLEFEAAIQKAKEIAKEQYPQQIPNKTILIVQHLEEGQVYNITLLTMQLCTINIKITTTDGNLVDHKLTNLMDFRQSEEPKSE